MVAGLLEYASLAILYSLLAAGILEAALRLWRVKDPRLSVRFRVAMLAAPPAAPLLFAFLNRERGAEPFRQQVALLDLHRWLGPEPALFHPAWLLLLALMGATTLAAVGLEINGFLRHLLFGRSPSYREISLPKRLQEALEGLGPRGFLPSSVRAVAQAEPAAYTAGLRRPTILVTTALVDLLDQEEMESVLAHEMAHVTRRDNWLGWLIFGLRFLSFYNPVALFTFHQISHDLERVCDADAAVATGKPLALASALIKVYRASYVPLGKGRGWPSAATRRLLSLENRARRALVEDRVERLVHPDTVTATSYPSLRLVLALAAVLALSYLVV